MSRAENIQVNDKFLLRKNSQESIHKIKIALQKSGWDLQENEKTSYATLNQYRVWFKNRGLYFTIEPHIYSEARFMWVDPQKICEMSHKRISAGLIGLIRKLSVQGDKK